MTLNSSLLQWLATFELDGQPSIELKDDAYYNLADGYVCARILSQICPMYFTEEWLQGIKPVPPNGSWRFRVSNLKRILKKIYDYASDLQSSQFKPNAIMPDVAVIAQNFDADHISRLIQLILFCTINCEKKQDYIEKIRDLPTQVKQDIKEAIEQLLISNTEEEDSQKQANTSQSTDDSPRSSDGLTRKAGHNISNNTTASPMRNSTSMLSRRNSSQSDTSNLDRDRIEYVDELRQKLNIALTMKEEKAQACYELEKKLKQIQFERDQYAYENEKLTISRSAAKETSGSGSVTGTSTGFDLEKSKDFVAEQNAKLQLELSRLKEEIIKLESEREDFRLKSNLLKEDLDKVTLKHEELRAKADQAKRLQDELDEHKHMSEKVVSYETTIDNLVKKNNDLKRELKSFEEKNVSYIQNIVKLEQENSQLSKVIAQLDIYKRQLNEAQTKLSHETHRADTAEVELLRLKDKLLAREKENERLYETTRAAQHVKQNQVDNDTVFKGGDEIHQSLSTDHLIELQEKVARLAIENEMLQAKLDKKTTDNLPPFEGLMEATSERCAKLEIENRQARRKILLLEAHLKDLTNNGVTNMQHQGVRPSTSAAVTIPEDSSSDNAIALMNRVEELQQLLFQKDQELMESEQKYKKNIHKAKEVIKTLHTNQAMGSGSFHPSYISSSSPFNSTTSLDEVNALRQQLHEREERLIELEREFYEFKKVKEVHERLILSAFYGLTTSMQWKNAASRLERTTLTSPPNTANNSMHSNSKHSH